MEEDSTQGLARVGLGLDRVEEGLELMRFNIQFVESTLQTAMTEGRVVAMCTV